MNNIAAKVSAASARARGVAGARSSDTVASRTRKVKRMAGAVWLRRRRRPKHRHAAEQQGGAGG